MDIRSLILDMLWVITVAGISLGFVVVWFACLLYFADRKARSDYKKFARHTKR